MSKLDDVIRAADKAVREELMEASAAGWYIENEGIDIELFESSDSSNSKDQSQTANSKK